MRTSNRSCGSVVHCSTGSRLAQPVSAVSELTEKLNLLGRYCSGGDGAACGTLLVLLVVVVVVLAVLPALVARRDTNCGIGSSGEPESDFKAIAHSAHLHSLLEQGSLFDSLFCFLAL